MSYLAEDILISAGDIMSRNKILTVLVIVMAIAGGLGLLSYARSAEPLGDEEIAWLMDPMIAHKGIHSQGENIPENSLSAFAKAMEEGLIIELDVSMTKDKQLVVFHDKKLKRIFGVEGYLSDLTYEELSKMKIINTEEKVPLFRDALSFIDGKVPLLIEIKNEGEVGEMEGLIAAELQDYPGRYAVQAFNPYTLKWFRNNAPQIPRGQLAGSFIVSDYEVEYQGTTRLPWYKKILLKNMLLNFESKPNFIAYEVKYTSDNQLNGIKKLGVPVLGWTIQTKEEYDSMKDKYANLIVDSFE